MAEPRRIFAPPEAFSAGGLHLEGQRLRHLRTVLRLAPGDEFSATDGAGAEYLVRVEHLGRDRGLALVLGRTEPQRESALDLVIAQALPRGDRFSFVLEKATELGVRGIRPLISRRTAATGGAGAATAARWRRIVESAVAQSGRTRLPVVHPLCSFEQMIANPRPPELQLLLWEHATEGLRELIASRAAPRSVLVAIGPEGSWSEQEVQRAERAGFVAVRFGPRILRTDTAGVAALAVLQSRWGDLG
ncbi:MAG: 16S rRNA (uracil(1498)-N(3))-methyltransferase [Candidatus Methylomirabilia bacterium]